MRPEASRVYLNLTNNCNLFCRHCYLRKKGDKIINLSWQKIRTALVYYRKNGFESVELTGGEPFLSPYFRQTVKLASKLGYIVGICTNGTFPEIIEMFSNKEIKKITFSLDGISAETDSYLRGKKHFNLCMSSIKRAKEKKFEVQVIFCVNKKNVQEIEQFVYYMDKLKVSRISFNFISYMGNCRENKEILISPEEWIAIRKRIEKISDLKNSVLRFPLRFITKDELTTFSGKSLDCVLEKSPVRFVLPDGKIYDCCLATEEDIYEGGMLTNKCVNESQNNKNFIKKYGAFPCPIQTYLSQRDGVPGRTSNLLPVCLYRKTYVLPKK